MNIAELLNSISPETYRSLRRSAEIGKWPNGDPLSREQRELCLQAVIAYEEKHRQPEDRSGYIPPQQHTHCGSKTGKIADDPQQPLVFR